MQLGARGGYQLALPARICFPAGLRPKPAPTAGRPLHQPIGGNFICLQSGKVMGLVTKNAIVDLDTPTDFL
jgi:hypothetical protein